ncbi:hypothetical protein RLIN73S_07297 [Rhodanobacter lindaniclasticus]
MSTLPDAFRGLSCQAIAFVRSPYGRRMDVAHQPSLVAGSQTQAAADATIAFVADFPAAAYCDLAGFERIWLVFAFHRSEGWNAQVRPPRGGGKRGVLATRSPYRPNAIGLLAVELLAVDPVVLRVRGLDLLDGTPFFEIRPYVPYAAAFPQARAGWIDAIGAAQGRDSALGPRTPGARVDAIGGSWTTAAGGTAAADVDLARLGHAIGLVAGLLQGGDHLAGGELRGHLDLSRGVVAGDFRVGVKGAQDGRDGAGVSGRIFHLEQHQYRLRSMAAHPPATDDAHASTHPP